MNLHLRYFDYGWRHYPCVPFERVGSARSGPGSAAPYLFRVRRQSSRARRCLPSREFVKISVSCPTPPVPPTVARPLPFSRTLHPSLTQMRRATRAETWSGHAGDLGVSGQRRKRAGSPEWASYCSANLGEPGRQVGLLAEWTWTVSRDYLCGLHP